MILLRIDLLHDNFLSYHISDQILNRHPGTILWGLGRGRACPPELTPPNPKHRV
jgi:hypothetical protein